MTKRILVLIVIATAISCHSKYSFWGIDKFRMDTKALDPLEEIKLLYSGRAPENNQQQDYYIQVVVVSMKSGDTVNILTTMDNGFSEMDGERVFNFIPDLSPSEHYTKIARDPKFDKIADNKFPAILGSIGVYRAAPTQ